MSRAVEIVALAISPTPYEPSLGDWELLAAEDALKALSNQGYVLTHQDDAPQAQGSTHGAPESGEQGSSATSTGVKPPGGLPAAASGSVHKLHWMAVEAHQTHVDDIYANHGPITRVATIGGETTINVGWSFSTTGGKTRRVVVGRSHTLPPTYYDYDFNRSEAKPPLPAPPPPPAKTTAEVLRELRAQLEADYAAGRAARNTAATTIHLAYIDGECGGLHRALSYLREYE